MASVNLYLATRVPRKDGTYPLKIAENYKGKFLIILKIYLKEDQLIGNEVVGHKNKKTYNLVIDQWLVNIKRILLDLGVNGELKNLSTKQLKDIIENQTQGEEAVSNEKSLLFRDHLEKFIQNKSRIKDIYLATLNKIAKYYDLDNLILENINLI